MKLKTLNDLRWLDVVDGEIVTSGRFIPLDHPKNTDMVYVNELKEAAKEWIDFIEDDDTLYSGQIFLIDWIKKFFNLD